MRLAHADAGVPFGEFVARTRAMFAHEGITATMSDLPPGADPWSSERSARLSDAGLMSLCVPQHHGGTGHSALQASAILEEAGRVLLPESLTATNLAMLVLAQIGAPVEISDDVARGRQTIGWLGTGLSPESGRLCGHAEVLDTGAPYLMVGTTAEGTAWLLRAGDVQCEVADDRDVSRPLVRMYLDEAEVVATWQVDSSLAWLSGLGTVMYAAEAAGAMAALVEATVRHIADPEQVGSRIDSFPSVKRQCSEMWARTDLARTTVRSAATALDADPGRAGCDVAAAASSVVAAFDDVARTAVRLHGGMGHAYESSCHLFVRRALVGRRLLGDHAARRRTLLHAVRRTGRGVASRAA